VCPSNTRVTKRVPINNPLSRQDLPESFVALPNCGRFATDRLAPKVRLHARFGVSSPRRASDRPVVVPPWRPVGVELCRVPTRKHRRPLKVGLPVKTGHMLGRPEPRPRHPGSQAGPPSGCPAHSLPLHRQQPGNFRWRSPGRLALPALHVLLRRWSLHVLLRRWCGQMAAAAPPNRRRGRAERPARHGQWASARSPAVRELRARPFWALRDLPLALFAPATPTLCCGSLVSAIKSGFVGECSVGKVSPRAGFVGFGAEDSSHVCGCSWNAEGYAPRCKPLRWPGPWRPVRCAPCA